MKRRGGEKKSLSVSDELAWLKMLLPRKKSVKNFILLHLVFRRKLFKSLAISISTIMIVFVIVAWKDYKRLCNEASIQSVLTPSNHTEQIASNDVFLFVRALAYTYST